MLFTSKMDLKLIKSVQTNPILYDSNNPKYMDFNSREVVWQMIGDGLKRPANECKERWVNIRDVHRRMLKKRASDPKPKKKPYKYERELTFMIPYYKDSGLKNITDYGYEDDDKEFSEQNDDYDVGTAYQSDDDSNYNTPSKRKKAKKSVAKKKTMKFEESDTKATNSSAVEGSAEFDTSDPVDAFLLSIGATLRTFSPYHLNLAKSKIFSIVQEHDLQQIVHRDCNDDTLSSHDVKVSTSDPIYLSQ